MKRRNFLNSLVLLPIAAKGVLSGETTTSVIKETPKIDIPIENETDLQSKALTEYFFDYIKLNKPKFNWARLTSPVGTLNEKSFIAKTRTIKYLVEIPTAFTQRTEDEKLDIVKYIVKELEAEYRIDNIKTFYFYQFIFTPLIYDPETFLPRRGIFMRYAWEK